MYSKTFLSIVVIAATVQAAPQGYRPPQQQTYNAPDSYEQSDEAKYDFEWSVEDQYSGNDFGQQESRDGDFTSGSYYVLLPDGRTQTVTYTVDGDSGFVAEVSYDGEARYPEPASSNRYERPATPAPAYQQPRQTQARSYQPPTTTTRTYQPPVTQAPVYQPPSRSYQRPSPNAAVFPPSQIFG